MINFYPIEIILNAIKDNLSFVMSKEINDPFKRVAVVFACITPWTCWQNIIGCISASKHNWLEVILMKHSRIIPQSRRITAISTRAIPPNERTVPILFSKCRYQFRFFCTTIAFSYASFFPVIHCINRRIFANFFSMVVAVVLLATTLFICILQVSSFIIFMQFVSICVFPFVRLLSFALTTMGLQFTSGCLIVSKKFQCRRIPIVTFSTALDSDWFVDHLKFSLAAFAVEGVDGAAKLAVHAG